MYANGNVRNSPLEQAVITPGNPYTKCELWIVRLVNKRSSGVKYLVPLNLVDTRV